MGKQDEDKHNKSTTQYVLDTTIRKQAQITQTKHESSHKQLEAKTNRTLFLCGKCNGHHITELKMQRHMIGQDKNNLRDEQHEPHQNTGMNSGVHGG